MELAGNMAKDGKRVRITPRDIYLATSLDQEFCKVVISSSCYVNNTICL